MKTITVECPDVLADDLTRLSSEGWIAQPKDAVVEAILRFLDSHRPELIESQLLSDVEWGLHGKE